MFIVSRSRGEYDHSHNPGPTSNRPRRNTFLEPPTRRNTSFEPRTRRNTFFEPRTRPTVFLEPRNMSVFVHTVSSRSRTSIRQAVSRLDHQHRSATNARQAASHSRHSRSPTHRYLEMAMCIRATLITTINTGGTTSIATTADIHIKLGANGRTSAGRVATKGSRVAASRPDNGVTHGKRLDARECETFYL